ncbi:MAG: six-cysteine ranthipeptide SCIFF [Clostridia bacterium]|nr:six-cysteine ranthipeptide SCIFF [Clostridia bacterium]
MDKKNEKKHVKTVIASNLKATAASGGCRECQTSCQSACKTSCTLGNQACRK